MIDFGVRSVIALPRLNFKLRMDDRNGVTDCDRENKRYHFPCIFSIAFLFAKALMRLGLSLLSQNTDMPSSAVPMDKYGFTAIRKMYRFFKASRARGFPPTHKRAREYPQPLQFFRKERK